MSILCIAFEYIAIPYGSISHGVYFTVSARTVKLKSVKYCISALYRNVLG